MNSFLNQLPVFEANQVLTSSQLNSMVDYLDQQNRITRVNLIGTGIVCGLELLKNSNGTQLSITKGMGLSSNGYLISLGEDRTATQYRPYSLPQGTRYIPFESESTHNVDVTLYELLTEDAIIYPSESPIALSSGFLANKVVLLFVEVVDVDLQSCLGKSCDEYGRQRSYNLRKLLISKSDMDKINGRINTQTVPFAEKFSYNSLSQLPLLPEIFMRKPLFVYGSDPNNHLKKYDSFSQVFVNALNSPVKPTNTSSGPDPLLHDLSYYVPRIFEVIEETYTVFETLLSPVYGATPFTGLAYTNFKQSITDFLSNTLTPGGPDYFGVQYVYDFMKDLVNAYNEYRAYAFELLEDCFQNMDAFPAHLMLSEFDAIGTDTPPVYRQFQSTSPLLNNQSIKADAAIFYHKRMVVMINTFDFNLINDIDNYSATPTRQIYLTPSNEGSDRLSKKAVPYYYKALDTYTRTYNSKNYFTTKLIDTWNYNFKLKRLNSIQGLLPQSYRNQFLSSPVANQNQNQSTNLWVNSTPLYYNLDEYDCLRVEGHLGINHALVKTDLEKIKTDFGLPINIVSLRLKGDSETDFSGIYNFDDLRTEYGSLRAQLINLIDNLLLVFPVVNSGTTPRTFIPAFIENVISQNYIKTANNGSIDLPEFGSVSNTDRSWNNMKASFNTNMDSFITLITTLKGASKLPYNLASMDIGYSDNGTEGNGFIQCYKNCLNAAIEVKQDINQLLDLVVRNWSTPYNTQFFTVFSTYINEKLNWIDNFLSDGKYKGIILVHYKYRYRITKLKLNDPELLSNFVQKHPGIEHTGTVKKGGTIVLVRNGGNTDEVLNGYSIKPQQVIADFSLPYAATLEVGYNSIAPEANDTTGFTLPVSGTPLLTYPAITVPQYYSYRMGDHAFAPDKIISTVAPGFTSTELEFSIIPELIYDPAIAGTDGTNIYLYLFDETGSRISRAAPISSDGEKSNLNTSNYCNPRRAGGGGSTSIAKVVRTGGLDTINYRPAGGINSYGIDSFYYMFEIVAPDGTVLARSGMGQITVSIDYHP